MANCEVVGCTEKPSKPGHKLCLAHWRAERDGKLTTCDNCRRLKANPQPLCRDCFDEKRQQEDDEDDEALLSATDVGAEFDVSAQRINLMFAELGWIQKEPTKGWSPTPQGLRFGAHAMEIPQSGIPYVKWSSKVLTHPAVLAALDDDGDYVPEPPPRPPVAAPSRPDAPRIVSAPPANFRDVHEAQYRTQDGHRVRSRAEVMIDDWLYLHGLVHSYEKSVAVELESERMIGDFWLPQARVWIEFWGMNTPEYLEQKAKKKATYAKYQHKLIELGDEELKSLDDHLPRLLRKFGIAVD